jgi:hypothetical protein
MNSRGGFDEGVDVLAREVDRSQPVFLSYLQSYCTAYLKDSRCIQCGGFIEVPARSWLLKFLRVTEIVCPVCYFGELYDEDEDEDDVVEKRKVKSVELPMKIYADHMIDIEAFKADPQAMVEAVEGNSLVIMKDGQPLFYCLSPAAMRKTVSQE